MVYKGLLLGGVLLLAGCVGSAVTGAQMVYDRHNVFKKVADFNVVASANRALYKDQMFRTSNIDVAAFNGDLLLAGQTPSEELKQIAYARVKKIPKVRRLFNQITVAPVRSSTQAMNDAIITTSIRTQIVGDDDINPNQFKVITENGVVYLLGDVRRDQAQLVVNIARHTQGVKKVVRVFRYYTYETNHNVA